MLYAEALKYEKSRNTLNLKLKEFPYLLNPSTLETLAPDAAIPVRPRARFAYMKALLAYLDGKRLEALHVADCQRARDIEMCVYKASLAFFSPPVP